MGVRLRLSSAKPPLLLLLNSKARAPIDRQSVNNPATEADFQAFKEGQIEVTESAEHAAVAKEAHVVEEVWLGKQMKKRNAEKSGVDPATGEDRSKATDSSRSGSSQT